MAIIIPGTGTTGPIQTLTETVKNTSGATLLKGTPVRITGATGQEADVGPADASTAFPANFILAETLAPGESGQAVALGFINNISVPNASLFTAGQEVYLAAGGGWTTTRPTGAANIQLLGNIVKVNTGANTVSGIFAPQNIEYLPNLTQGRTWIGNSSGLAEEFDLTSEFSSRDTANRNRANHTGTQAWNTITGTPTTTAGYGITDAAFNGQIINGVAHFVQTAAPTSRINAAGQNIGALVVGDRWYKPTDNGITGTAGNWIWTGSDWASVNVFPLSIPVVNGSSNNQVIRSESVGTNLGIRVSGLASQIAVLNANPTSANYWTAAISVSGTPVTTLSTQNAVSYPHNYSNPNIVIPARVSIPVGGVLTASALGQVSRNWLGMTTLGTDVYACVSGGDIYKQTNGTGNFIALGQTSRQWVAMTTLGTDVYASVRDVDIYKQTNGTGNFIALGQTARIWRGMTTLGTDVYACVQGGDIYKQTNGTGNFIALGQVSRNWYGMTTLGTDVYACVNGGDIYKQTGGTGDFLPLGQTSRNWVGMTTLGTNVYASVQGGDIYLFTGVVTSIGHSLEVTLTRTGAGSLPYVSITANCQVIHP